MINVSGEKNSTYEGFKGIFTYEKIDRLWETREFWIYR